MLTHAKIKKAKDSQILVKEDNPNRINMTQKEVIAENKEIKVEREKVKHYQEGLKEERKSKPTPKVEPKVEPPVKKESHPTPATHNKGLKH